LQLQIGNFKSITVSMIKQKCLVIRNGIAGPTGPKVVFDIFRIFQNFSSFMKPRLTAEFITTALA
jgi:hypothetical protein